MGWPPQRMKKVRGHLKGLRTALERTRQMWCTEENQIEAKRKQVTEYIVAKVLQNEERRKAFEARWNEVKARSNKALDEGTFEGPIVPIGFRPPEPRKKKAEDKAEDKAEKDNAEKPKFFAALDEPP